MEKLVQTFSYKRDNRLLSRKDFLFLKSQSRRFYTSILILYFKGSRVKSLNTRIGFSISKKIGKAFVRNRFKRILKEAFRHSEYKNSKIDGLFVINPKIGQFFSNQEKMEEQLIKDFNRLLNQATNIREC